MAIQATKTSGLKRRASDPPDLRENYFSVPTTQIARDSVTDSAQIPRKRARVTYDTPVTPQNPRKRGLLVAAEAGSSPLTGRSSGLSDLSSVDTPSTVASSPGSASSVLARENIVGDGPIPKKLQTEANSPSKQQKSKMSDKSYLDQIIQSFFERHEEEKRARSARSIQLRLEKAERESRQPPRPRIRAPPPSYRTTSLSSPLRQRRAGRERRNGGPAFTIYEDPVAHSPPYSPAWSFTSTGSTIPLGSSSFDFPDEDKENDPGSEDDGGVLRPIENEEDHGTRRRTSPFVLTTRRRGDIRAARLAQRGRSNHDSTTVDTVNTPQPNIIDRFFEIGQRAWPSRSTSPQDHVGPRRWPHANTTDDFRVAPTPLSAAGEAVTPPAERIIPSDREQHEATQAWMTPMTTMPYVPRARMVLTPPYPLQYTYSTFLDSTVDEGAVGNSSNAGLSMSVRNPSLTNLSEDGQIR